VTDVRWYRPVFLEWPVVGICYHSLLFVILLFHSVHSCWCPFTFPVVRPRYSIDRYPWDVTVFIRPIDDTHYRYVRYSFHWYSTFMTFDSSLRYSDRYRCWPFCCSFLIRYTIRPYVDRFDDTTFWYRRGIRHSRCSFLHLFGIPTFIYSTIVVTVDYDDRLFIHIHSLPFRFHSIPEKRNRVGSATIWPIHSLRPIPTVFCCICCDRWPFPTLFLLHSPRWYLLFSRSILFPYVLLFPTIRCSTILFPVNHSCYRYSFVVVVTFILLLTVPVLFPDIVVTFIPTYNLFWWSRWILTVWSRYIATFVADVTLRHSTFVRFDFVRSFHLLFLQIRGYLFMQYRSCSHTWYRYYDCSTLFVIRFLFVLQVFIPTHLRSFGPRSFGIPDLFLMLFGVLLGRCDSFLFICLFTWKLPPFVRCSYLFICSTMGDVVVRCLPPVEPPFCVVLGVRYRSDRSPLFILFRWSCSSPPFDVHSTVAFDTVIVTPLFLLFYSFVILLPIRCRYDVIHSFRCSVFILCSIVRSIDSLLFLFVRYVDSWSVFWFHFVRYWCSHSTVRPDIPTDTILLTFIRYSIRLLVFIFLHLFYSSTFYHYRYSLLFDYHLFRLFYSTMSILIYSPNCCCSIRHLLPCSSIHWLFWYIQYSFIRWPAGDTIWPFVPTFTIRRPVLYDWPLFYSDDCYSAVVATCSPTIPFIPCILFIHYHSWWWYISFPWCIPYSIDTIPVLPFVDHHSYHFIVLRRGILRCPTTLLHSIPLLFCCSHSIPFHSHSDYHSFCSIPVIYSSHHWPVFWLYHHLHWCSIGDVVHFVVVQFDSIRYRYSYTTDPTFWWCVLLPTFVPFHSPTRSHFPIRVLPFWCIPVPYRWCLLFICSLFIRLFILMIHSMIVWWFDGSVPMMIIPLFDFIPLQWFVTLPIPFHSDHSIRWFHSIPDYIHCWWFHSRYSFWCSPHLFIPPFPMPTVDTTTDTIPDTSDPLKKKNFTFVPIRSCRFYTFWCSFWRYFDYDSVFTVFDTTDILHFWHSLLLFYSTGYWWWSIDRWWWWNHSFHSFLFLPFYHSCSFILIRWYRVVHSVDDILFDSFDTFIYFDLMMVTFPYHHSYRCSIFDDFGTVPVDRPMFDTFIHILLLTFRCSFWPFTVSIRPDHCSRYSVILFILIDDTDEYVRPVLRAFDASARLRDSFPVPILPDTGCDGDYHTYTVLMGTVRITAGTVLPWYTCCSALRVTVTSFHSFSVSTFLLQFLRSAVTYLHRSRSGSHHYQFSGADRIHHFRLRYLPVSRYVSCTFTDRCVSGCSTGRSPLFWRWLPATHKFCMRCIRLRGLYLH